MSVQELLAKTAPPESEGSSRLRELIEREKARPMETVPFDVYFGETPAPVVMTEIRGGEWGNIAHYSPRPGNVEDAKLGCHTDRLLERYPVDRITIAGEHPTVEEWAQVVQMIGAPSRGDIVAALWWMHIGLPTETFEKLKKASSTDGS